MKKLIVLMLLTLAALAGCAHVISDESRRLVDPALTYGRLKEDPDAQVGRYVMLGGMIAGVKNAREGGQIEVVQVRLDDSGTPEDPYYSEGRFLATTDKFLDSLIFKPGRLVTIVGEVKGKKTLPLDEVDYTYPVIAVREIHIWKNYDTERGYQYPPPYYYYDPYYYGFWPGPWWHRPMGPAFRRW